MNAIDINQDAANSRRNPSPANDNNSGDPVSRFAEFIKPPSKNPRNQTNEEWLADYDAAEVFE